MLGVLLFELLCGRKPFQLVGSRLTDMERIICEQEPPLPVAQAETETKPAHQIDWNEVSENAPIDLKLGYGLVELVDPRTVSPLDTNTILSSVKKTGRLLIVDEPPASCGFAGEIAAQVASEGFDDLDAPIRRLTGAFCPTPYSPPLEAAVVPNTQTIVGAIRDLLAE